MEKTVQQPAKGKSKTKPKKACTTSMVLDDDEVIPEYICRESVQAMNLDELRALLYTRTITMKELKPTKTCKSSTILADNHIYIQLQRDL